MAMYYCEECGNLIDNDWHPMKEINEKVYCPDCVGTVKEKLSKHKADYWAKWFIETKNRNQWTLEDIDEGLMIAWFANAMMAMHDHVIEKPPESGAGN